MSWFSRRMKVMGLMAMLLLAILVGASIWYLQARYSKLLDQISPTKSDQALEVKLSLFKDDPEEIKACILKIIGQDAYSKLDQMIRSPNVGEQQAIDNCQSLKSEKADRSEQNQQITEPKSTANASKITSNSESKTPSPTSSSSDSTSTPTPTTNIAPILTKTYTSSITRSEPITLTGDQVMEIVDTDFTHSKQITLKDKAKLIIKNSKFNHTNTYSFEHTLDAFDQAQVIVEDSTLISSPWLNWNFYNTSQLTLTNVDNERSNVWHGFQNSARATIKNARFSGTISHQVAFDITDSPATYIEYVFPDGARVDETLPANLNNYQFPGIDDNDVTFSVAIKNSKAIFWGITVNPNDDITIRDVSNGLTVTFAIKAPLADVTAEFDDLKATTYADQTWNVSGMRLRLVNTKTTTWSPIVGDGNTLIIKNSELADNAFSWGTSKIVIENSNLSFVRAKDSVDITLRNSTVSGDVVAIDNGVMHLINTSVKGKQIQEGKGKILLE